MIGLYPIGTPCIFYGILFQNRDLLEEMQRTELLAASSKQTLKVMEDFVKARDGEETLAKFREHQDALARKALCSFSLKKLKEKHRASLKPSLDARLKALAEERATSTEAFDTDKKVQERLDKAFEDSHPTEVIGRDLDDIVKRAILKLQQGTS